MRDSRQTRRARAYLANFFCFFNIEFILLYSAAVGQVPGRKVSIEIRSEGDGRRLRQPADHDDDHDDDHNDDHNEDHNDSGLPHAGHTPI